MFSWAAIRARIKSVMAQLIPSVSSSTPAKPVTAAPTHATPKPSTPKPQKLGAQKKKDSQAESKTTRKTAWMKKGTGGLVETVKHESILEDVNPVTSEPGFETLCSYNWLNNGKAIFVPGGPPRWNAPVLPFTLKRDSGHQFIDQHAFHVPKYPFEPSFRALSIMNPNVQLDSVDIIANRNSLRKLLDFASGRRQEPFCMGLQMVKNTLFISRRDRYARQLLPGGPEAGFGHSFEKAFTKPQAGLGMSSSHHRVVRYHLGALDCLVRFEVDAFYVDSNETNSAKPEVHSVTEVTAAMEQAAIQEQPPPASKKRRPQHRTQQRTIIIEKGAFIAPSQLAEIKAKKLERIYVAMPQLWFGRTPYFFVGQHNAGTVHAVSSNHVESRFVGWEETNQARLRKLVSLLAELRRITRETKKGAATLVCEEKGAPIQIFEKKNDEGALPRDIVEKHWGKREDDLSRKTEL